MKSQVINKTSSRVPKSFISLWNKQVFLKLKARRVLLPKNARELVVVIVSSRQMKKLNAEFRGKDYATDVLSFEGQEPASLGELIVCIDVLKMQAKQHGLTFKQELGYMLLHGILHLLGYDHERGVKKARQMFKLQDDVFEELCNSSKHVATSRKPRDQKKIKRSTHIM